MLCRCSISFEEHQTQNMAPLVIGLMLSEQSQNRLQKIFILDNMVYKYIA